MIGDASEGKPPKQRGRRPSRPGSRRTAPSKPRGRTSADALWRQGEDLAARHLESLGYRIIERNWRSPHTRNEIDLIAVHGPDVVIVEVKTARSDTFGDPLGWITPRKRKAIITAARAFVAQWSGMHTGFRFDAITIGPPDRTGHWPIHHVPNAFT